MQSHPEYSVSIT